MTTGAIETLFDTWNAALQTRDPDEVVKLYAEDAVLLPTVSNQVRHNHAEIRDYFVNFLKKHPRGVVNESNVRDYGDVASNAGVYTFDLTTDGVTAQVPCRFTFLYRKESDGWKIVEHHSSQMPEPA